MPTPRNDKNGKRVEWLKEKGKARSSNHVNPPKIFFSSLFPFSYLVPKTSLHLLTFFSQTTISYNIKQDPKPNPISIIFFNGRYNYNS